MFQGARDLKTGSRGRRANKKNRIVFPLCLVPVICPIRPRLVVLIPLFCYAGLAISFHRLSIIRASLPFLWHSNESHFPSYCVALTLKQSSPCPIIRGVRGLWKGGGGIRSHSWTLRMRGRSDSSPRCTKNKVHLVWCVKFLSPGHSELSGRISEAVQVFRLWPDLWMSSFTAGAELMRCHCEWNQWIFRSLNDKPPVWLQDSVNRPHTGKQLWLRLILNWTSEEASETWGLRLVTRDLRLKTQDLWLKTCYSWLVTWDLRLETWDQRPETWGLRP